jgi:hypothetical protein
MHTQSRKTHEDIYHDRQRHETYVKKKEEWFVRFCLKHELGYDREVHISYRHCGENDTWARLDFVFGISLDLVVIASIDEFQHVDYDVACEVSRMSKVVCSIRASGDTRRIVWLRVNPDYFSVDGEKTRVSLAQREEVLLRCLRSPEAMIGSNESVAVWYMWYDCHRLSNGDLRPDVLNDPTYDPVWQPLVRGCIV